jgi:hypothetical protein
MAARNFSLAQYGAINDQTATGIYIGSIAYAYAANKVDLKDHTDSTVGFSLADDKTDVTISGAIVAKTTGLVPAIGGVLTLANSAANSLTLNSKGLFTTPVANAGVVVTGATMTRTNSDFESGDITAVFHPGVTTNAPVSVS